MVEITEVDDDVEEVPKTDVPTVEVGSAGTWQTVNEFESSLVFGTPVDPSSNNKRMAPEPAHENEMPVASVEPLVEELDEDDEAYDLTKHTAQHQDFATGVGMDMFVGDRATTFVKKEDAGKIKRKRRNIEV